MRGTLLCAVKEGANRAAITIIVDVLRRKREVHSAAVILLMGALVASSMLQLQITRIYWLKTTGVFVEKRTLIPGRPTDPPQDEGRQCRCVNCEGDELCGGLWKATRFFPPIDDERVRAKRIHAVISHCKRDLSWLSDFTKGFDIASIHVISKCGESPKGAPAIATIEALPNVGRCDHTYAYYIANILDRNIAPGEEMDSIVVFFKDDMSKENLHQPGEWASFASMVRIASSANGFACGIDATSAEINRKFERISLSPYHDTATLSRFTLPHYKRSFERGYGNDGVDFASTYDNLRAFYENITEGRSMPELAQVCYGGIFAASYSNIKRRNASVWQRAQYALSRGDNIEEGHFMERCWGPLLATALPMYQMEAVKNYASDFSEKSRPMLGMSRRVVLIRKAKTRERAP